MITWRNIKEWWMLISVVCLTAGIGVLFALLIPALGNISDQAEAGGKARDRQCDLRPISNKLYLDLLNRKVITRNDLAQINALSLRCPTATTTFSPTVTKPPPADTP